MFELRHQHFIAWLHEALSEAVREQVQRLGRSFGKHHTARIGRINQRTDLVTNRFKVARRCFAQCIHAAMDVGTALDVRRHQRIKHHLWLLARRCVIEINQRQTVYRAAQGWKVCASSMQSDGRCDHGAHYCMKARRLDGLGR